MVLFKWKAASTLLHQHVGPAAGEPSCCSVNNSCFTCLHSSHCSYLSTAAVSVQDQATATTATALNGAAVRGLDMDLDEGGVCQASAQEHAC
jgi:hypothetical protein